MATTPTVNEKSTAYLTVAFKDQDGNGITPNSAYYYVYDVATGTKIKDNVSISPLNTSITLTLDSNDTEILSDQEIEHRQVIVTSNYGSGATYNDYYDYYVVNLNAIT